MSFTPNHAGPTYILLSLFLRMLEMKTDENL